MHNDMLEVPHHDRPTLTHGMAEVEPGVRIHYLAAYASPGGIRAAFETYRTFEQDTADIRAVLAQQGKLRMPMLFLGGELSFSV